MHITIAINGEGRGHFSRARALAEILKERHRITFRAPAHLAGELRNLFPDCTVREIPYLAFEQNGFTLDILKTIVKNIPLVLRAPRVQTRLARELREEGTQMVLSDFEPFTSRAAKLVGIPVLQLNHPGVVTRSAWFSPSWLLSAIVSNYMMGHADKTLICSFFDGDIGPIVRAELRNKERTDGDYFVVYQKPLYREFLAPVLSALGEDRFRIFPDSRANYADALAGCAGLIAPAGHQSISEALALGKPVFVIPVQGQFEQELNAFKLKESGCGDWCFFHELAHRLPSFIHSIKQYQTALQAHRDRPASENTGWLCRDDTARAADLVERFILESTLRPEWRRPRLTAPLVTALFPEEIPAAG